MGEPISDEEFAEKLRAQRELLNLDQRFPRWFWEAKHFAYFGEEAVSEQMGRKLSPKVVSAFEYLRWTLEFIEHALAEGVGPEAESALRGRWILAEQELQDSYDDQKARADIWRKKSAEGLKRGYASDKKNWLEYWDDAWAVRRDNGKGWKVGNKEILDALPDGVPQPDRSTITRQRKERYKELNK